MDKRKTGLYEKFRIVRADGQSAPGSKHYDCEYFVLDLTHDPYALPALRAYADACYNEYPNLASDLLRAAADIPAADHRTAKEAGK